MELKRSENLGKAGEENLNRIAERSRALVMDSSVFIKWFSKDKEDDMSLQTYFIINPILIVKKSKLPWSSF
jgi:hypothetical protein